jgi:hypothetical protein
MQSNSFSYSLKVWLTSVVLAPVTVLVTNLSTNDHYTGFASHLADAFVFYMLCMIFGGIFSFITWIIFLFIIKGLIAFFPPSRQLKHLIAVAGTLLTVGTFAFFGWRVFDIHNYFFYLMLANCVCIAGGSHFYKLENAPNL